MADIQFEHIDPWVDGQGDTGLTARQKLRRNFEKIKAWMDSVTTMLSGKYLSKEEDDEAEGVITFKKGSLFGPLGAWGWVKETVAGKVGTGWAWFKNLLADTLEALSALINGNLTVHGGDLTVEEDELGNGGNVSVEGNLTVTGLTTLLNTIISNLTVQHNLTVNETATITNLIVTGAAHFFKVIIDEIKAAGGAIVVTPADGFTVDLVENITINGIAGKRLYWRVSDGQKARTNKWHALDQALCKTDNLANGTTYNASNKFYWSLVAAVSPQPVEKTIDGNAVDCHYIDIYCGNGETQENIPKDGNDVPLWYWVGDAREAAAGDEISMLGSRDANDVPRQSALYFSAYTSIDTGLTAPFIASYRGVNDFNLASHRKTYMDAVGQAFFGQFFSQSTDSDNPTDIEDWLTGSELKIIYGEGSPLVTQPEQHWTQADRQTYVDRCFYYDISLEPALDGGRFWKWTMQAGDESPTFSWVHVTDGDTLAALEKIADVASDSKLSGGGEKTRVYLEWLEAKKTAASLMAQAEESGLSEEDSETYDGTHSYTNAYNAVSAAFTALSTYLNNKVAFTIASPGFPAWIDPSNTTIGLSVTTQLPSMTVNETTYTGADYYRLVWKNFWDAIVELTRAINAWQYRTIEQMGDDGFLDPQEKASLRQIFSAEVQRYFRMLDDFNSLGGTSAHYDDTHTLSNIVIAHLNNLGTYLDGEQLVYMTSTVAQGGNPSLLCLFEYDSETGGYKPTEDISVVSGKTYYKPEVDEITWEVNSEMREGLTDEMFYPATMESGDRTGYPRWLLKENETQSQVVEDKEWDYFWNKYWSAANTMEANLAKAHQKAVDEAVDELQPQIFIQLTAPTNYKAGDHWYQPTTLKNPVTGANVSQDSNGNPIYNHYIAVVEDNTLKWKLVNAATTSVFSQLANQIYQAVFDSTNASSLVMRANSIESTVSKIKEGSQNLLINSHFEDGTNHWAAYNSATISVVAQSGLPLTFEHCLKVQTSSGAIRGMQFSKTQQPYILLEEGKTYTFSFWAKADASKRIYVYRGTTNLGLFTIGTDWDRYGYTIEGDGKSLNFSVRDYNSSDAVTFYLVGLQLECGSRSDWQDFGGEPVMMKSQILQLADKISMGVFKDEARKAGIDIEYDAQTDSGTVTLDGDKVIVEGDLDVKGLVHNSSKSIRYDDWYVQAHMEYPDGQDPVQVPASGYVTSDDSTRANCVYLEHAVQMIVPIDLSRTKNVNVKGMSGSTSQNVPSTNVHPMVVLPGYTAQTLEGGLTLPAVTESGIQINITNSFHAAYKNWSKPPVGGTSTGEDIKKAKKLMNGALLVVADANLLKYSNYGSSGVGMNTDFTTQAGMRNSFHCKGLFSKLIAVMPGQTLSLVSSVEEYGDGGTKFLVWYVQNASEYVALNGSVRVSRWNGTTLVDHNIFPFTAGDYYANLSLMATEGCKAACSGNTPLLHLVLESGLWPYRMDVNQTSEDENWSNEED